VSERIGFSINIDFRHGFHWGNGGKR